MSMRMSRSIAGAVALVVTVLWAFSVHAQDSGTQVASDAPTPSGGTNPTSGSGAVTLSAVADSGSNRQWQISFQGPTGDPVTGTVQITGFTIGQPGQLGKVDWQLSGNDVSGTVNGPAGSALATFTGIVNASGAQGTFIAANGQGGNWAWTGSTPQAGTGTTGTDD